MNTTITDMDEGVPLADPSPARNSAPPVEEVQRRHRLVPYVGNGINYRDRVPGATAENTVWDVYNNEARKVDNEMVNDWRESLNSLLVFAAIFAAVLAAFIIESKKMLEQDQTQLLVSVTVWNVNNMGNSSNFPYTPPEFEPTPTAVSVNCLLFASLGTSLFAALASVVALQWVADYDAAITRGGSSAEDRAKRRQFRFAGVKDWKMEEMIAALPLLLYASVTLFWAGAIQWMWMLHPLVGYVVAGGTGIAVLFYVSTTLIASCFVSAPFRTPLSRAIYWVYHLIKAIIIAPFRMPLSRAIYWVYHHIKARIIVWNTLFNVMTLHHPEITRVALIFRPLSVPLSTAARLIGYTDNVVGALRYGEAFTARWLPSSAGWSEYLILWLIAAARQLWTNLSRIKSLLGSQIKEYLVSPIQISVVSWISVHFRPSTARQREDKAANDDSTLEQKSLIWLANQLPMSADSDLRLDLLFTGVLDTLLESMHSSFALAAPWLSIFEPLSGRFLRQILDSNLPEENYRHVGILVGCIEKLKAKGKITHSSNYELSPGSREYWSQCCFSAEALKNTRMTSSENMSFLLARDVPVPSVDSMNELKATVELIKWRNQADPKVDVWIEIILRRSLYSNKYMKSCMKSFKSFVSIHRTVQGGKLWLSAQEAEKRCQQVLDVIKVADYLIMQGGWKLHSDLIWLICEDMKQPDQEWPCLPDCPKEASERVAEIQDPCLALIAAYTCGFPMSNKAGMTKAYSERYRHSLLFVQNLLCRELLLEDTEDMWQLRAAVIGDNSEFVQELCKTVLQDPKNLTLLERIFEHPTRCYDHSQGPHHLLFHLYERQLKVEYDGHNRTILGDVPLPGREFNLILLLLAFSDHQDLSYPFSLDKLDVTCVGRIKDMCYAVKQHPPSILTLLSEIAKTAKTADPTDCTPQNVALVLELVEQARAQLEDVSSVLLLRPLADSIRTLRSEMLFLRVGSRRAIKLADAHAQRISGLLYAKSASMVVSSSSHSRMLSCAWTGGSAQPAIGWLPIYLEI